MFYLKDFYSCDIWILIVCYYLIFQVKKGKILLDIMEDIFINDILFDDWSYYIYYGLLIMLLCFEIV